MAVTKDQVLAAIKDYADKNGGAPPGRRTFEQVTGISEKDWSGRYWARWGDAVQEAGFTPNVLQARIGDDVLLRRLADLTREFGRFPTSIELRMKRRDDASIANDKVYRRFGDRAQRIARLAEFCRADESYADVLRICEAEAVAPDADDDSGQVARESDGFVYLVRSGQHYKIGQTNHLGRRSYELDLQLPERGVLVHSIRTDDPQGIERYWHERFGDRRANGEWFRLSAADVKAFRRRKFM